jgi:hypothetical protein
MNARGKYLRNIVLGAFSDLSRLFFIPVASVEPLLTPLVTGTTLKTHSGDPKNHSKYLLTDRNTYELLPPASPSFYISQGLIVKAKVMGYFVAYHFCYFCLNFVAGATLCLYRPLKDAYLIGQD